jgi:hypothetical protein
LDEEKSKHVSLAEPNSFGLASFFAQFPCKLKLDEEKSKHVSLAEPNSLGPASYCKVCGGW